MNLKRYRVNNIQEALQQIKKDLGPDAVIVSTRQVKESSGKFGLFGKTMLEVTAARDTKPASSPAPSVTSAPKPITKPTPPPIESIPAPIAAKVNAAETRQALLPIREEIQDLKNMIQAMQQKPSFEQKSIGNLQQELGEMKRLIHSLAAENSQMRDTHLHENLLALFQQMVFAGLEEKFAKRLVVEAQKNIPPEELENFMYVKIFIARMAMKIVKTTNGIEHSGRQKIISLIGPTGVGKTTTVAKIASNLKVKHELSVSLITLDTYRVGAIEHLRSYAKIMKIPFDVVADKQELESVIAKSTDIDCILIDTGGRSQRNPEHMAELHSMINNPQFENYLTLSATTKDAEISEITRRFGETPIEGVIFTKLDESTTCGCIFNHAIRFKKPVAFLTTGQQVPEDIEPASKERLVDLLLNISGSA